MILEVIHKNGKKYRLPVSQIVAYLDNGEPCAITFEHAGIVIHTDSAKKDFGTTCARLRVTKTEPVDE